LDPFAPGVTAPVYLEGSMRRAFLLLSFAIATSSFGQTEIPPYHFSSAGLSTPMRAPLLRGNGPGGLQVSWLQGGHSQGIPAIAFSPDGQILVTGANNGVPIDSTIKVWSVTGGTLLRTLKDDPSGAPFQEAIACFDFSPDGHLLASGETNGRVSIWDTSTWTLAARFYSTGLGGGFFPTILSIRFSPNGELLVAGSTKLLSQPPVIQTGGIIDVRSVSDWSLIRTLGYQGQSVYSISFFPDSIHLAAAAEETDFAIWNVQAGSIELRVPTAELTIRVAFSPTGLSLVTSSAFGLFELWDPSTWQRLFTLSNHGVIYSLSYSADGTRLSGATTGNLRVWDTESGALLQTITGYRNGPASVALSPDGSFAATGGGQTYPDIQFSEICNGSIALTLNELVTELPSAAISSDGALVAVGETAFVVIGTHYYNVHLFNAADGSPAGLLEGHTGAISALAPNPADPNLLASASGDRSIRIWDLTTHQTVRTLLGHSSGVDSVVYSPDGRLIASGSSDHLIKLWNADTGEELNTLYGHTHFVRALAFSPDGLTLVSGSLDTTAKLWNVETGQEITTLAGHNGAVNAVAFSPDGTLVATGGSDGLSNFWDPTTGQLIRTLSGHTLPIRTIGFAPGGSLFVSGGDDRSMKLWNACTGDLLQTVVDEMGNGVDAIAFSPDGRSLSYTRKDGTLVTATYPMFACEP
jgi:WD40 repeat protein